MELMFWGLQYWRVWGSSLWDQMAETDAWHPWVTTLPSGHASIRSRRSTTYCTRTSPLLSSSAFVASFGESEVNWLIEIELSRLDKQRASGMLLILAERLLMRTGGVKLGKQAGKRHCESKYDMLLIYICVRARVCVCGDGHTHPNKLYRPCLRYDPISKESLLLLKNIGPAHSRYWRKGVADDLFFFSHLLGKTNGKSETDPNSITYDVSLLEPNQNQKWSS